VWKAWAVSFFPPSTRPEETTMPKGKGYSFKESGSKMPSKGGRTSATTSGSKKKK
jgi:hypothetical protein